MKAILIVGNWASGKSELLGHYQQKFVALGTPTIPDSDRIRFEEAVLLDAREQGVWDGQRWVGEHSYLTRDGEPGHRHFMVRSGIIPNREHDRMIADIRSTPEGTVRLVEYAIGNDIKEFEGESRTPFLQSGAYLLGLLGQHGVKKDVGIVELIAPVGLRLARQFRRDDRTDGDAFFAYAQDGGELYPYADTLDGIYVPFHNTHEDLTGFWRHADDIFDTYIIPRIRGEGVVRPLEGSIQKEEER